jgi:ankyrin repeat protein
VLFSVRPLKPIELYFAVLAGTDPDELGAWDRSQAEFETIKRFITSASRGLVEIVPGKKYYTDDGDIVQDQYNVQFIHQSVIDFLTRNQRLVKLDPRLDPKAVGVSHARLASCCMVDMMQEELRSLAIDILSGANLDEGVPDVVKESYPLFQYTLENLLAHAENAQAEEISQVSLLRRLGKREDYENLSLLHDDLRMSNKSFKGGQLLYALSLQGCYYLVRALLVECGADVNAQGGPHGTALQAAAACRFTDIVTLLLERGADVNAHGGRYGTALQVAAHQGSTDMVALLLKRGADVNAQGGHYGTALQAAAHQGSADIVALLLKRGADVNAQGGPHGTALQAAVGCRFENIVTLLLEHRADVNAQGGPHGTALQAAAACRSTDMVALFLKRGADVNAQGGRYGTALQVAAHWGSTNMAALLLECGADVNAQGGSLGTALQEAVASRFADIVTLLLERGADVNAQGGRYGTALQAAAARGFADMVALLLERGAKHIPP